MKMLIFFKAGRNPQHRNAPGSTGASNPSEAPSMEQVAADLIGDGIMAADEDGVLFADGSAPGDGVGIELSINAMMKEAEMHEVNDATETALQADVENNEADLLRQSKAGPAANQSKGDDVEPCSNTEQPEEHIIAMYTARHEGDYTFKHLPFFTGTSPPLQLGRIDAISDGRYLKAKCFLHKSAVKRGRAGVPKGRKAGKAGAADLPLPECAAWFRIGTQYRAALHCCERWLERGHQFNLSHEDHFGEGVRARAAMQSRLTAPGSTSMSGGSASSWM